jgi:DNA-binding transcriptional ArsR family regulator
MVRIDPLALDNTLVALADATRRAILLRLSQGETRVTELAAPFEISLNSVSKHIRMLERAQLVRRRVAGREHWLSLDPDALEGLNLWLKKQRALWSAQTKRALADQTAGALQQEDLFGKD